MSVRAVKSDELIDSPEQATLFENVNIDRMRLGLQSAGNLPTRRKLEIDQHISGRFWGTVRDIRHTRNRDGQLVRHQLIEVTEVQVDG